MNGNLPDDRRVELQASDDEAHREYGRQLAMDALLDLALRAPDQQTAAVCTVPTVRPIDRSRRKWLVSLAAACVVAAAIPIVLRQINRPDPPLIVKNDLPQPLPPAPLPQPMAVPGEKLIDWTVEPAGDAQFRVLAAHRVQLTRGELHVQPAASGNREPLVIETEFGTLSAGENTEFLIGTHYPPAEKGSESPMFTPMTRVLVLAGIATLATPDGALTGAGGHLLAAERDKPPVNLAVEANNGFAFDLYGELARKNSNEGLFFSPYSLAVALSMTAEGARGETAGQMARVLHFSEAARRLGDDAQAIPFNMALLHTGFAALNQRWNRNGEADRGVRRQIESLRKELADANNKAAALRQAGKADESNKLAIKSQDLARQLNALSARVDQFELRVANALWGEKTYPFRQDYIATINRYYGAGGVFPADFRNQYEAVRRQINQWAAERTNQKIRELISPTALSPEDGKRVRLILTNAIYFKGEWSTVFREEQTKESDFLLTDGGRTRVSLMHHGDLGAGYAAFNGDGTPFNTPREVPAFGDQPQVYPGDDGFALLELPYKGGELSMVVIAPRSPDGLSNVEKLLTPENWPALVKALVSRPVDTYIPRFKLEKSFDAADVLKALGMVRAFEIPGPNGADFDGLCASADPELRLYIGKVLHAAQVDVNEKGTEAAAATAVITAPPPSPVPQMVPFTPQFRADRAFTFLIRDKKSDTILFIGRVTNPKGR